MCGMKLYRFKLRAIILLLALLPLYSAFAQTGTALAFSTQNAPKLGKLAGASLLAFGSFILTGNTLRIDAKVVNSESGVFVASGSVQGNVEKVLSLQAELSEKLMLSLGIAKGLASGTTSVDAAKAYYTGLSLFDLGKYDEAVQQFKTATEDDPLYAKPRTSIEESYKFLKDFKRQRQTREMNALIADIQALKRRLSAPVFLTFTAALSNPGRFGFSDAQAVSAAYQAHPNIWNGDTPVQAIWDLQHLYMELADKGNEYAENAGLNERCIDEIAALTRLAEKQYADDPFLPEVLYSELFGMRERNQWQKLKTACECLMSAYPDFRMMWAIEDMYKAALEKLKTQQ